MTIAVILGNRMNDDGTLSGRMLERLQLCLKLYGEIRPEKIIVSGGVANKIAGISEADAMAKWLIENGISSRIIIKEDKSISTKQNAKFSVPIALNEGATEIIICSSKEHIARKYLNPLKLFKKYIKKYGGNIPIKVYTN